MKPQIEIKTLRIGDINYPLKNSARAQFKFIEMSGHSLSEFDSSFKDSMNFLYSCLWGGGLRISFDEFLDLIDDEDIAELIGRFTAVIVEKTSPKKKQTPR